MLREMTDPAFVLHHEPPEADRLSRARLESFAEQAGVEATRLVEIIVPHLARVRGGRRAADLAAAAGFGGATHQLYRGNGDQYWSCNIDETCGAGRNSRILTTDDPPGDLGIPSLEEEISDSFAAGEARYLEAQRKATDLLRSHLTPEQRQDLLATDSFVVIGSEGGRYRVGYSQVKRIDCFGRTVSDHCLGFDYVGATECRRFGDLQIPLFTNDVIPNEDLALAKKLMIEIDEPLFLETSNRTAAGVALDWGEVTRLLFSDGSLDREALQAVLFRIIRDELSRQNAA